MPEYDKLDSNILAEVVEQHSDMLAANNPVTFNRFVEDLFHYGPSLESADWCYFAALAMVAAKQSLRTPENESVGSRLEEIIPIPPEPSKLDKAKDFLSSLLRPRVNPSSVDTTTANG